jgi:2-polyprenyl-6-methoxyphenol hydroxylase-like FAD-dependent oxidoreductase
LKLEEDPIDHLIAGLLVGDVEEWPEDLQAIGKVGDIQYLIFPQGGGKARLYADYDISDRNRFAGESGAANMLAAFDMDCVPKSKVIANATPLGPCRSNPSQDAWIDDPWVDGVVLIGDAAGFNDPILGQGVSVTARDARIVADLLTQTSNWSSEMFTPYGTERKERLRRLRMAAKYTTTMMARFGPEADARRARARERQQKDPELMNLQFAAFIGPENIEAHFFEQTFQDKLFA